jgi:pyrimidine-nucleoside phosphorylase
VCSLGLKFAKLSGRGLGHTGGTIDKLESFIGFDVNLTAEQFEKNVNEVGGAVSGQTATTVPADKKLYALRDVTATVDSIPLIASSIMSKKLASFADVIVLDVKYGSGAFMKTKESAEELATLMVAIGKNAGRKVSAVVTSMEQPLGDKVGCNAEVKEAIEILKGKDNDLKMVSFALAKEILVLCGYKESEAEREIENAVKSGKALAKLEEIVRSQGGDTSCFVDASILKMGKFYREITCEKGGFLSKIDTEAVGNANVLLGGGRLKKEDSIDHESGIEIYHRLGDSVQAGDVIFKIYTNNEGALDSAEQKLKNAITVSQTKPKVEALIHKIIR